MLKNRVVRVATKRLIGPVWRVKEALLESEDSFKLNTAFIERLNLTIRDRPSHACSRSGTVPNLGSSARSYPSGDPIVVGPRRPTQDREEGCQSLAPRPRRALARALGPGAAFRDEEHPATAPAGPFNDPRHAFANHLLLPELEVRACAQEAAT